MKTATVRLKSTSAYSQSKCILADKLPKESSDAFDKRTWREHLHYNERGEVYLPPMALKNCLSEAAKFLGVQIPGKGKSTYTKHIEAGVLITDPVALGIKKDDVEYEDCFLNADGVRGSGKRVWKRFPIIRSWTATATFYVLDETITEDVFMQHLTEAGRFIGIGRWRPRNNGLYGRFSVELLEWK